MSEHLAGRGTASTLLIGCAGLMLGAAPLHAQNNSAPDPAQLDPSAPLDPMPDLGLDWPDLNTPDPAPPPEVEGVAPEAAAAATEEAAEKVEDASAERRYHWFLDGLDGVEEADAIREGFKQRSTLEKDRKDESNAAQVDRRARADAELLAELLRSQGYYDAVVEPRIEVTGTDLAVELEAVPGARYRFESVELPGLDAAAGEEAGRLREAFAVKAGDP